MREYLDDQDHAPVAYLSAGEIAALRPSAATMLFADSSIVQTLLGGRGVVDTYPAALRPLCKRNIQMGTLEELRPPLPFFAKMPGSDKAFAARVVRTPEEAAGCAVAAGGRTLYVSEVQDFVSEHRLFLSPGRLWGLAEYSEWMIGHRMQNADDTSADPLVVEAAHPPQPFIDQVVALAAPLGFVVVDVGLTQHGEWCVVEANPPFALSSYDLDIRIYVEYCVAAWQHLVGSLVGGTCAPPASLRESDDAPAATSLVVLQPHAAFNTYMQTSVVLLDCCATQQLDDGEPSAANVPDMTDASSQDAVAAQGDDDDEKDDLPPLPAWTCSDGSTAAHACASSPDGVLAGSAWLDASKALPEAAEAAFRYVMDERTPDDTQTALLLFDELERARSLAAWLRGRGLRRVLAAERAAMRRDHPYLLFPDAHELVLPSEIVPGRLYLGSAAAAGECALRLLHITAVVSLLDRVLVLPDASCAHLLHRIADERRADLDGAVRAALPFITAELAKPHGRVLVHCEAGQSRSASIVIAALMAAPLLAGQPEGHALGVDEAIAFVRAQRPQVRPNDGFMEKLRARAWMDA